MRLLEIQAQKGQRRFINLDLVTKLILKGNEQIEIDVLGGGFEVVEKGGLGYQDLLRAMGITHDPASGMSELEEEGGKE